MLIDQFVVLKQPVIPVVTIVNGNVGDYSPLSLREFSADRRV